MKNYKLISTLILGSGIALASHAHADIQEACIITAKVERLAEKPDAIRLKFTHIDHGEEARCKAKGRRGGLARLNFSPPAGDTLAQLANGTEVHYRYERREGEAHWYRLDDTELQITQNLRNR